jgi:hypothetical protein
MSALRLDASAPLGLAYACLLAGLALWVWEHRRSNERTLAAVSGLAWAAAALLGLYLLAQAVFMQRTMFMAAGDFLAVAALGVLLGSRIGRTDADRDAVPFALALIALTHLIVWPPAAAPGHPAQTTLLYALQAGLGALGVGACLAAVPDWWSAGQKRREPLREWWGLAAMGIGFALGSAWAWLNWGVVWRSDPRLNLMLAGWLLLLAGQHLGRLGRARVVKTLGLAVILLGALGADLIARGWPHLPFVAW